MLNLNEIRKKTEEARSRTKKDLKSRIENYIVNAAERGYNQVHLSSMMMGPNDIDFFNMDNYDALYGDLLKEGFKIITTQWNTEDISGNICNYRDRQFASIKIEW